MTTPAPLSPKQQTPITESSAPMIEASLVEASPEGMSFAQQSNISKSPFAAMFKNYDVTHEDVQKFINGCLKALSREIKRNLERSQENMRRMKRIMDGKDPD